MGNSPSPPPPKKTLTYDDISDILSDFGHKKKETRIVRPSLKDYYVSKITWYHRPLNNNAKHLGGKHSKLKVEFKLPPEQEENKDKDYQSVLNQHRFDFLSNLRYNGFLQTMNDKWKYADDVMRTISFVVERHQSGVYISSKNNISYKDEEHASATDTVNYKNYQNVLLYEPSLISMSWLWGVNTSFKLDQFLKKCCTYPKYYEVNETDCHCFASSLFASCVFIQRKKVNNLLTQFAAFVGVNSQSSRRSSPPVNHGPINKVDSLEQRNGKFDDATVLEQLEKYQ